MAQEQELLGNKKVSDHGTSVKPFQAKIGELMVETDFFQQPPSRLSALAVVLSRQTLDRAYFAFGAYGNMKTRYPPLSFAI